MKGVSDGEASELNVTEFIAMAIFIVYTLKVRCSLNSEMVILKLNATTDDRNNKTKLATRNWLRGFETRQSLTQ